jgi:hypothetical protein
MERFARDLMQHAKSGLWDGKSPRTLYFERARRMHPETGTLLLLTRENGYHTSGWFKNPDYERCFHLSMSFWDLEGNTGRSFEHPLAKAWCCALYGPWMRYIWEEGPALSKPPEVRHYRVFVNAYWQPIIPRGEVYNLDFTEKGWKSWSDLQGEKKP